MRYSVKMPRLSEGDTGTIVEWSCEIGHLVKAGETLVSVGLDKVDVEIPAPISGRLASIEAHPGDQVCTGGVICVLET